MQLRYYQEDAIQSVFDYWSEKPGNPLLDIATGAGKSLIMSFLIKKLIDGWPDMRIMVVTHVEELISQNYAEFLGVMPFADTGIYSAGLGQRNAHSQVIFAGIQTVYNKAYQIGKIDVIMIDEAHLVPRNTSTRYGAFISDMRAINPDLKIVGLTATPYRMDSGRLDEGDDRMFDDVTYTYGILDGVNDGYLTPLSTKATVFEYDTDGIGKLGGDFKKGALQAAVDTNDKTKAAVAEIVAKAAHLRSWLSFCSGVDHAFHVRDEIRKYGISCETITGNTPKGERREIWEAFKNYEIRSLTNYRVLTTGANHKGLDLIAAMGPTLSLPLYVQEMGRLTRPLYAPNMPVDTAEERRAAIAAGPKPRGIVLDFAKLVDTHGPVDCVNPKKPGKGDGEAPFKTCPLEENENGVKGCGEKVHASARECPECGFEFPFDDQPKITTQSADAPIMSTAEPDWRDVTMRTFRFHEGKGDKPPTIKVTYMSGLTAINEWLCPEHQGFPKSKADRYWRDHGGQAPFPKSVMEWLERQNEIETTIGIQVVPNGRYWNVIKHASGAVNDNIMPAANDNVDIPTEDLLDDDIPF